MPTKEIKGGYLVITLNLSGEGPKGVSSRKFKTEKDMREWLQETFPHGVIYLILGGKGKLKTPD